MRNKQGKKPAILVLGKEVFDLTRKMVYGWDPEIPFKPVNSGKNRAVKEELLILIDYLMSCVQEVGRFFPV